MFHWFSPKSQKRKFKTGEMFVIHEQRWLTWGWQDILLNFIEQLHLSLFLVQHFSFSCSSNHLLGLVVKPSILRAADLGFNSCLHQDFSGWFKNWHSSGYPARRLALEGQSWDWLAWCQFAVTGWDRMFDMQLLSKCGSTWNCPSRSVPEIH